MHIPRCHKNKKLCSIIVPLERCKALELIKVLRENLSYAREPPPGRARGFSEAGFYKIVNNV